MTENNHDIINKKYETFDKQLEYAWNWFNYHAQQRISMFNFSLIANGIILSAISSLYKDAQYEVIVTASVLGVLLSVSFVFLDYRNKELVHVGENILIKLEKKWLFTEIVQQKLNENVDIKNENNSAFGLLKWDEARIGPATLKNKPFKYKKHSVMIPFIEILMSIIYILSFIYSLYLKFDP